MSDPLMELNPQQRAAVTASNGQVLVLAGPGSGKTRVLTQRIIYLICDQRVRPSSILAVTFTNKASREMQSRLENALNETPEGIWLGTFHGSCARLLRREADRAFLPFDQGFVIMDSDDQEAIVKRALKDLNLNEKLYRPAALHAAISNAKNNLLMPEDLTVQNYRDEVLRRVYEQYQEILRSSNGVDFDDLLLWAVRLLGENPKIRDRYSHRFEHVLVDEFQDTNLAQYQLLQFLCSAHHNLFVVGDEDQSIYRWRGADYRNILRLEQDYPGLQKILLEQNYRSTQTVLDAARSIIDRNKHRTPKRLFSDRGVGEKITLYEAVDDFGEAAYVVDVIQQHLAARKSKGGDFAIMYRTNAQSRLLEEAFLRAGLPYRLVGALRFYGRREVKDTIAFLRLVHNPNDQVSLTRVINTPPRGIGEKTMVALQLAARQAESSPGKILLDLGEKGQNSDFWKVFSGRGATVLADFGGMFSGWQNMASQSPLPVIFDRILSDTAYHSYLNDGTEDGDDRWANVQELRKMAYEYQERGLVEFLENLALVSDQDTLPDKLDAPTLLTLHAAKGLEFPQVFIIGLDECLLPHSRSRDDPEELAEERRLFYVGLTRAQNQVILVRAGQRSSFGTFEYSEPSRFLDDIPENLLIHQGMTGRRTVSWDGYGHSRNVDRPGNRFDREQPLRNGKTSPPTYPKSSNRTTAGIQSSENLTLKPTQRVRHPVWGDGVVLESRIDDHEETADIHFESVGFKRLIVSLAKLEIL